MSRVRELTRARLGRARNPLWSIAAVLASRGVRNAVLVDEGGWIFDKIPGVTAHVALIGIAEKGYTDIKTLVAFSGTVEDPKDSGKTWTEVGMNGGIKESELPEKFDSHEYQVLILRVREPSYCQRVTEAGTIDLPAAITTRSKC